MDAWIQSHEGRFQWTVLAEWKSVLLGSLEWPIDRWRRQYLVECVKQGPHRAVYRVQTPQGAFYAKHYRASRWTDVGKNVLRGCPARREFEKLQAVAQRGVPTLRPIGWVKPHGWQGLRESLLLTEALPNVESLDHFFHTSWPQVPPKDQPRLLRTVLDQLACFLAQCHQAGILHHDLHAGNILLQKNTSLPGRGPFLPTGFFLIDVQDVRLGNPLDRETSIKNLCLLAGAWRDQTTPAQRWRFWTKYCQARPELAFDLRRDAERIDQLGWEHRLRISRRRDRRSLAANRDFMVLKFSGRKIYALAHQDPEWLQLWALAPELLVEQSLHRAVKLGHHSVVVEADWPVGSDVLSQSKPLQAGRRGPTSVLRPPHFSLDPSVGQGTGWAEPFSCLPQEVRKTGQSAEGMSDPTPSNLAEHPCLVRGPLPADSCFRDPEEKESPEEENLWGLFPAISNQQEPSLRNIVSVGEGGPSAWPDQKPLERSSSVGEKEPPESVRVAIKRFRERLGWGGWKRYFRTCRAKRAWWAGHALRQRGIATPPPLALCEPPFRGGPYYTYLISEWIEGAQNLHLWGWQIASLPHAQRYRLAVRCAESLGRLIGRLHAFRITHGDLKMSNLLVTSSDRISTWLLDVEGVRIGDSSRRRYRKDLVRLALGLQAHPWVPPTVVCRFLRTYVQQFPPFARPDWKTLWRTLRTELDRQIKQKAKDRPLL